ncbi:hypothetical protein BDZ94DRAFT_1250325 [Collybia nuda]|uniref:F-box domain-containing protein n=1 Tax=Collybia nuda TaxID=64659 RepID=A0A9P6CNU6_9AGAR|nr:hypothetical protein BDZ94DRAFT_1250325 [Collybia nuda]
MHPCLQINEILTNIFESTRELEATEHPRFPLWPAKGSKNLAALARACKTFSEPALDLLWEFQPSLAPLVRCLPGDALAVKARKITFFIRHDELMITRDLSPSDWERVNHYARRIRTIGCYEKHKLEWSRLSFDALATLQLCKIGPGPILPNLLHFSACISHFLHAPLYPSLVVGSNLKTLDIYTSDSYQTRYIDNDLLAANLIFVFGPTSSSISSCSLLLPTGYAWGIFPSPVLTRLYCGFTSMQKFNLQEVHTSCEALITLSDLPYLRSLKMVISGTQLEKFNSIIDSDTIFSRLEELWIRTDALIHVQEFFGHPGIGALHTFQVIEAFNHANVWDVSSFVDAFHRQQGVSHLRHFGIFEQPFWGPRTDYPQITNRALTPLLSYVNMTTLTVNLGVVTVDDDMLKKMAVAWPHLQVLDLTDRSTGTIPQATLSGIFPLVACCRDLRALTIRLNVLSDRQPKLSQMEILIPGKALEVLNICTSPVEDVDSVASTIQSIFPRLNKFRRGWIYCPLNDIEIGDEPVGVEGEYYRRWGAITEIVCDKSGRTL